MPENQKCWGKQVLPEMHVKNHASEITNVTQKPIGGNQENETAKSLTNVEMHWIQHEKEMQRIKKLKKTAASINQSERRQSCREVTNLTKKSACGRSHSRKARRLGAIDTRTVEHTTLLKIQMKASVALQLLTHNPSYHSSSMIASCEY